MILIQCTCSTSQVRGATNPVDPNSEASIEQPPAPAYSNEYGKVDFEHDGFESNAKVASRLLSRYTWSARPDND